MRNWSLPVLIIFVGLSLFPQGADTRPQFEVVSIRRCDGTEPRGAALNASPGRLSVPCFGLLRLIQGAYQAFADGTANFLIQPPSVTPIEGFPNQMSSFRYSIVARAESPQSLGMMMGPMMQKVLEDRFHLKIHPETREAPVYIMTVAKGGTKLQATTESSCIPPDTTGMSQILAAVTPGGEPQCGVLRPPTKKGTHFTLDERGITLASLSKIFNIGGLPVIDHTGLTETFDVHLEWEDSPPDTVPPDSERTSELPDTSILSSFRKQLGLQTESGQGTARILRH